MLMYCELWPKGSKILLVYCLQIYDNYKVTYFLPTEILFSGILYDVTCTWHVNTLSGLYNWAAPVGPVSTVLLVACSVLKR